MDLLGVDPQFLDLNDAYRSLSESSNHSSCEESLANFKPTSLDESVGFPGRWVGRLSETPFGQVPVSIHIFF